MATLKRPDDGATVDGRRAFSNPCGMWASTTPAPTPRTADPEKPTVLASAFCTALYALARTGAVRPVGLAGDALVDISPQVSQQRRLWHNKKQTTACRELLPSHPKFRHDFSEGSEKIGKHYTWMRWIQHLHNKG